MNVKPRKTGWAGSEIWPISRIEPHPKNPRTHPPQQISLLAEMLLKFGPDQPIVVDEEGVILKGHGRRLAAIEAGIDQFPVFVRSGLSDAEKIAIRVSDNQVALLAGWDEDLLRIDLNELSLAGYDMPTLGFEHSDLIEYMAAPLPPEADPENVPEVPVKPVSKTGDLWIMGEHRLLCGDSTSDACVDAVMAGDAADICFTSPPYAQQRDYGAAHGATDWDALMTGVFSCLPMKDAGQVLVNLGLVHQDGEWLPYWERWVAWMREQGWKRFGWYVWDQMHGLRGNWAGRCAPSFEFVFHFNKRAVGAAKWVKCTHEGERGGSLRTGDVVGKVHNPDIQSHKVPDAVWRIQRQKGGIEGHPAPFSVALVEHALKTWPSAVVYEPFAGSGTTLIACEMEKRFCRAIELSPAYVDVGVKRWQELTGREATLADDGRTFAQITKARAKSGKSQTKPPRN